MKPFVHIRKLKGYCCWWCDGPISRYKRIHKKQGKRRDKQLAKKEILKQLEEE